MPRAGRKTRRWALSCGLVVAAVAWMSWPRERLLLEMAHPVLAVDTRTTDLGYPKETVWWLGGNRLLIITTESLLDDSYRKATGWKGHAELFDTVAHKRTRLIGLTNLLNGRGRSHWGRPVGFQLSPTGTRLYWWAERLLRGAGYNPEFGAAVATLEGTQLREWLTDPSSVGFWTSDQHFVDVMYDVSYLQPNLRMYDVRDTPLTLPAHMMIRDVGNPRANRYTATSGAKAGRILARYDQSHPLWTIVRVARESVQSTISRVWFDTRSGQVVIGTDAVMLPKNTRVFQWPYQPADQTTVPFVLQRSETTPLFAWLHRLFPSLSVKPVVTEGLWVSNGGGRQMLEIGHVRVRLDENNNIEGGQIENVQRLPDGKRISFIFKGMLYVMPISPAK